MEEEKVVETPVESGEEVAIEEKPVEQKEHRCPYGKNHHSLFTNPNSKHYDPRIARRRAKEKNRRHVNSLKRHK